jgi:hypothetical protein
MSSWAYYVSGSFLYAATTNVFNVIALLSAVLLLLDPIVFVAHSGYNFYADHKAQTAVAEAPEKPKSRKAPPPSRKPVWWKWYAVSATIHLLDAWFFRSIVPFFERAQANQGKPSTSDLQDIADITRILWGIVRSLSLFVIGLEIWETRLVLKSVLGQHYDNPKWGFAISYFVAPAIIAVAALPVGGYLVVLALWNSTGFFLAVVKDAFTPDWRHGQDVFVARITETVTSKVAAATSQPVWKFWGES